MASKRSGSSTAARAAKRPAKRAANTPKPKAAAAAGKPKLAMGINRVVVTDGKINAR